MPAKNQVHLARLRTALPPILEILDQAISGPHIDDFDWLPLCALTDALVYPVFECLWRLELKSDAKELGAILKSLYRYAIGPKTGQVFAKITADDPEMRAHYENTFGSFPTLRLLEESKEQRNAHDIIAKQAAEKGAQIIRQLLEMSDACLPADDAKTTPKDDQDGKGKSEPPTPFIPLTNWREIIAALNELLGGPHLKNDESTRLKIRATNEAKNGPISFPPGQGKHPSVNKSALLEWWGSLSDHYDARTDEAAKKRESTNATVAATHDYGATGTVAPDIGGSIKVTRRENQKKGKEPKR